MSSRVVITLANVAVPLRTRSCALFVHTSYRVTNRKFVSVGKCSGFCIYEHLADEFGAKLRNPESSNHTVDILGGHSEGFGAAEKIHRLFFTDGNRFGVNPCNIFKHTDNRGIVMDKYVQL